jgi:putative membrane protein
MDSDHYYNCLCELYDNLDQYIGVPIEVEGFVFKDNDDFTDKEFVPARLMMVCCAADMQLVGLLCQYDQTSQLQTDSWVRVSGTITEAEVGGQTVPSIIAQNVVSAKEPDDTYVYPY